MTTYTEFLNKPRGSQRLGQAFVNEFVEGTWPEIFYQEDDRVANRMICEFLWGIGVGYDDEIPTIRPPHE